MGSMIDIKEQVVPLTIEVVVDVAAITLPKLERGFEDVDATGKALGRLLEDDAFPAKLLLDLREIDHIGSMGLGMLIGINKKARARGRQLRLCNLKPNVHDVIRVMRLNELLDIRESRHMA